MITYIFGFLEEDSGKTTIGLHAIKYLKEIGIDVAPFKPIAGFNYWRQYENFLNSAHYGTIFSRDAYMLEEIAKSGEKLEIINPVSFLFAPADIKKYIESNVISKILFEETLVRNLVLARLTICENDKIENQVYLNKRRLEYLLHDSRIFHIIESRNSREIDITDIEKFINEINVNAKRYIESCFRKLVRTHRNILVESFNNSVLPWRGILNEEIDIVIGAFPGYALFFDPISFKEALVTLMSLRGDIITGEMLLDVLNPKKVARIPPITKRLEKFEKELYEDFVRYLEIEIRNII